LLGDHPAEQVGRAARRIGHDQFDGLARVIFLRPRRARGVAGNPSAQRGDGLPARQRHAFSLIAPFLSSVAALAGIRLAVAATEQRPKFILSCRSASAGVVDREGRDLRAYEQGPLLSRAHAQRGSWCATFFSRPPIIRALGAGELPDRRLSTNLDARYPCVHLAKM